ncbi:MAG: hypothetical protein V2A77_02500 [Pseudomonadota bacterium]
MKKWIRAAALTSLALFMVCAVCWGTAKINRDLERGFGGGGGTAGLFNILKNGLYADITTLRTWATSTGTLTTELVADHATNVTWDTAADLLMTELVADHATNVTWDTASDLLQTELVADHATIIALEADLKTLVNNLRTFTLNHRSGGLAPTFAIDTNFDVKNTEVTEYVANGVPVSLADNTNCDTGTTKTIAADQWAGMLITGSSAGALTGAWTADCASEAAAITAVKALSAANQCPLGYVTVLTASGQPWIAGTSALETGTGGNVSADTNYYNYDNIITITAAVATSPPATLEAPAPGTHAATLGAPAPGTHAATLTNGVPTLGTVATTSD